MSIRIILFLISILSYNALKSQDYISNDSLSKQFCLYKDTNSTCFKTINNIPCNWFKLRNTELGLVIYDRDNKPFNIKFINQDTLFQDDYFEFYHFVIDSTKKRKKQYNIYCHDTVAWGNYQVHFQFNMINKGKDIYSLSTILYRIDSDNIEYYDTLKSRNLYMPFKKRKKYYILREPNQLSCRSKINFLQIDYDKIELYRNKNWP